MIFPTSGKVHSPGRVPPCTRAQSSRCSEHIIVVTRNWQTLSKC
jgi:hypothetical protein